MLLLQSWLLLTVECSCFLRTNQIVVQGLDRLRLSRVSKEGIATCHVVVAVVDVLRSSFLLITSGRASISGFRSSISISGRVYKPLSRRSRRWCGCQLKRFLVLRQLLEDVVGKRTPRWIRPTAIFEVVRIFSGPDFLSRQTFSGICETRKIFKF